MKGKRILITGGAGFIGSHLVDRLGDRNEVTTVDDLSTGTLRNLSVAPRTVRWKKAYGPRQDPSAPYAGVMAKFAAAVAANRPIEIYGDGEQTRDFLYVGDIAEGLELAGEKPVNGQVINLGSGEALTVNDVVRILSEIADRPIRVARKPARPGDILHSRADVTRAKETLGFVARTSVREGLEKTLQAMKARKDRKSVV